MSGTNPISKIEMFKFVREEVRHEYTVLGSRLTSYITSQSFLVSAYAVAMNNSAAGWGVDWRLVFPMIVCVTGLTLSLRAQPGITSTVRIINALHERQRILHQDPDVQILDWMDPNFMIEVHEKSLQFSTMTAYVFSTAWVAMMLLTLYIRCKS